MESCGRFSREFYKIQEINSGNKNLLNYCEFPINNFLINIRANYPDNLIQNFDTYKKYQNLILKKENNLFYKIKNLNGLLDGLILDNYQDLCEINIYTGKNLEILLFEITPDKFIFKNNYILLPNFLINKKKILINLEYNIPDFKPVFQIKYIPLPPKILNNEFQFYSKNNFYEYIRGKITNLDIPPELFDKAKLEYYNQIKSNKNLKIEQIQIFF